MTATYKGKTIVYDIDTNTYNDGFSTTFIQDLLIAEKFGANAIKDTYNRVVKYWIHDVRYFTDFVMALNHLAWNSYEHGKQELSKLYSELYQKATDVAYETYKNEELQYFFGILD